MTTPPIILTGEIDWRALMEQIDADLNKRDVMYRFSNGREFFEETPGGSIYQTEETPS